MTVEPTTTTPRRDVLCGLVVALLGPGALVAACGRESNPATPPVAAPAPLAALSDIPDGSGLVVDKPTGGKVLLVRTGNEVKAYNAACTHKGTILEPPRAGTITCPKHGAQFDAATGSVKKGPATLTLATVPVAVRDGKVILA